MTRTGKYKMTATGSIDYSHYISRGRTCRSIVAHGALHRFADAMRALFRARRNTSGSIETNVTAPPRARPMRPGSVAPIRPAAAGPHRKPSVWSQPV